MKSRFSSTVFGFCRIALIGLMASHFAAAEEPGSWIEDAGGCKFQNPHPRADEKITWNGGCRDGFGDGQGVLEWIAGGNPGTRVEGNFVHGVLQGQGRYVTKGGGTYDGNFDNGAPNGFGTMVWPNGDRYDGAWRDGKRTGHGTFLRPNGDRYDGDFVDGKWEGKGLYVSLSGVRYIGDWVNNKRQGEGAAALPDGGIYRGQFTDDVPAHPQEITHKHYKLKSDRLGSYIGKALIENLPLPADEGYDDLSADEKFIARAAAGTPSEADEPPYPLHGPRQILEASIQLQNKLRTDGGLFLSVTVNVDGVAQDVAILSSPDKELSLTMAKVLMVQRYKPALCAGKPCVQKYYFRMNFGHKL